MTDAKMGVVGLNYLAEQTITQFVIPAGAGATFAAANNICTFTTNAAHGLTFSPAAGVPANYYVTFGGTATVTGGTGVLVGNIFRVLSIPSTTTFTFYSTITAATVTATTVIPVFIAPFIQNPGSTFQSSVTQSGAAVAGAQGPYGAFVNCLLGANCNITYNPDNTAIILDGYTTPSTGTPAVAPVYRNLVPASSSGQVWMYGPDTIIQANGTTATSRVSVIE